MRIINCDSLGVDSDVVEDVHPDIKLFLDFFGDRRNEWITVPQCLGGEVYQLYTVTVGFKKVNDEGLSFLPQPFWEAFNSHNFQILDAAVEQGRIRLTFRIGTTPLAEDPDSP